MQGYLRVYQQYYNAKTLQELINVTPERVRKAGGIKPETEVVQELPSCGLGDVIFRVEDDGRLVEVASSYDSSD